MRYVQASSGLLVPDRCLRAPRSPQRQRGFLCSGMAFWKPAASSTYFAAVTADSPLGYWRLGEATGTTAADSGSGNHPATYVACTQGGAALVTHGGGNLACYGDGATSHIDVGAVAALYGLSRNCSIEAWVKPASVAGIYGIWSAGYQGIGFRMNNGNVELLADYSVSLHTFTVGMTANAIYHVVLTISSAGLCTLYINGASVGTYSASYSFIGDFARIGADGKGTSTVGTFLSGGIDEVAVYTTALTATRVLAHYNAGK